LLSLARVELARHQAGAAGALDAARKAAVECQSLLAKGASPAVEAMVADLLRRIDLELGESPVDAAGRGRPGKPVRFQGMDDALRYAKDSPPIDTRIESNLLWEGRPADSALFAPGRDAFSSAMALWGERRVEDGAEHLSLERVLGEMEGHVQGGALQKGRELLA